MTSKLLGEVYVTMAPTERGGNQASLRLKDSQELLGRLFDYEQAEEIARRLNAHEALVDALRLIVDELPLDAHANERRLAVKARAALKKAGTL